MNVRAVLHVISYLLGIIAATMLLSAGVSALARDPLSGASSLGASAAITFAAALCLFLLTRGTLDLSRKDGFGIATFGWLIVSAFGALPFVLSGAIREPAAAFFESMSGFTTTGATVIPELEGLPRGILFWRAMTHFLGGMGVLSLCVAILPFLKVGGVQIYRAEMPGPTKDRMTPRIAGTAKMMWGLYVLFCLLETLLLAAGGMGWLDSWCHACATMATGGFSTRTASVGAYGSAYIEIVITVFMFIAGTNFALHLRLLSGKPLDYFRNSEFRFYVVVWLTACSVMTLNVWGPVYDSFWTSLRAAFFQGTSILTTTGFATQDFDGWPQASRYLLVLLMFFGGCAGSTGGGIKNIRVFVVLRMAVREVYLYMRPQAVEKVKIGGETVKEETVSNIAAFVLIFFLTFALGALVLTAFTPDIETAASASIACLGNIGPGLGAVGPTRVYDWVHPLGQAFMAMLMLLGRLELFTVLVILMPSFWKK